MRYVFLLDILVKTTNFMLFPQFKNMIKELGSKPFASKNAYRVYSEMHHGWAGARANLDNENNLRDFTDVYGRLATFFKNASEA